MRIFPPFHELYDIVLELSCDFNTESNVLDYRRVSNSHHKSHFDQEMSRYCCAEEAL